MPLPQHVDLVGDGIHHEGAVAAGGQQRHGATRAVTLLAPSMIVTSLESSFTT
jgi:hypothetical protein